MKRIGSSSLGDFPLEVVRIDCEQLVERKAIANPRSKEAIALTTRDSSLRGSIAWRAAPR